MFNYSVFELFLRVEGCNSQFSILLNNALVQPGWEDMGEQEAAKGEPLGELR